MYRLGDAKTTRPGSPGRVVFLSAAPCSGRLPLSGLPADDRLLARQAPVVTGERAGTADNTMTGDDEGNRVASDRRADGARGRRLAEAASDVGIGRRGAEWHGEKRLPDADLEVGADHDDPQRGVGTPQVRIKGAGGERRGRF